MSKLLPIPENLSALLCCRKIDGKWEDFSPHIGCTRLMGDPPYYLVRVTVDSTAGEYWGWWEPSKTEPISMVFPDKRLNEVCFTYGSKAEEDRGKGRVVQLRVELLRQLNSEECRTKNIPELK